MKKLKVNNEIFEAEKIIKTNTDIIGYNINNNIIFSFKGISNFSMFALEDGQAFDTPDLTTDELSQTLANSQLKIMEQQQVLDSALQLIADLQIKLAGGK